MQSERTPHHEDRQGMTTSHASQAMGMANAHGVARLRPSTLHVRTVPAGLWSPNAPISPISAFETTDRKPGRLLRRTQVSTT
jgi:hypothetical protein